MAAPIRGLIATGFPLGILVWGGFYLNACVELLKAPDAPVAITVKGTSDDLEIRADSYKLDVGKRNLSLRNVHLVSTHRGEIGRIGDVNVTELGTWPTGNPRLSVLGNGVKVQLLRKENGDFAIQELIPPPSAGGAPVPLSVRLRDVEIRLNDKRAKSVHTLRTASLDGASLGDDWRLQTNADLSRVGQLGLDIRLGAKGAWAMDIDAPQPIEATDVLRDAVSWLDPETAKRIQSASVSTLLLQGKLAMRSEASGFVATGSLAVRGTQLRIAEDTVQGFDGTVTGSDDRLIVRANAQSNGAFVQFSGQFLTQKPSLEGQVEARVRDSAALPAFVRQAIPAKAAFREGTYAGWVQWSGADRVASAGTLSFREASFAKDQVSQPTFQIALDQANLRAKILDGSWQKLRPIGEFSLGLASKSIQGQISVARVPIETLGKQFAIAGWTGIVQVQSLVAGTFDHPEAEVRIVGVAQPPKDGVVSPAVALEAQVSATPDSVRVRRAIFQTALGGASLQGQWSKKDGLELDGLARGLDFQAIEKKLAGSANVAFRVTGAIAAPRITGRVEAYDLSYETMRLPVAMAEFSATNEFVNLNNIRLIRGGARALGNASWNRKTDAISGSFAGDRLQVAEFAGEDFLGFVKISDGKISGSFAKPMVMANLDARQLLLGRVKIGQACGAVEFSDGQFQVSDAKFVLAEGEIQGAGTYDPATENGKFAANFVHLDIGDLAPDVAAQVTIKGVLDGTVSANVENGSIVRTEGKGTLKALNLNETDFGSGSWSLGGANGPVQLDFSLGTIDRYLAGNAITYNPTSKTLAGSVDIYNFSAEDIIDTTRKYQQNLSDDLKLRLASAQGSLSATVAVSGELDRLRWQANSVTASNVMVGGHDFGKISLAGDYQEGRANLASFLLEGPSGTLKIKGQLDPKEGLSADGELSKMPLAVLDLVAPGFAGISGSLDELSFLAEGTLESPTVRASAKLTGLFAQPGAKEDATLRVLFDTLSLEPMARPNGTVYSALTTQGKFFYRGFQGDIDGLMPIDFANKGTVPDTRLRLGLARRDLKEIASLIDGFDADRTEGGVDGEVIVSGPLNDLRPRGNININAPSLARNGVDATLQNAFLGLGFVDNEMKLTARATSSRGGTLASELKTQLDSSEDLGSLFQPGKSGSLLDRSISGFVKLDALQARQKFTGNAFVDAQATGEILVTGNLRRPRVSGAVSFAGVDTILPAFEAQSGKQPDFPIEPEFDVKLETNGPARVRTTGADLKLLGTANLTGTLLAPTVNGQMTLSSGTLRLPNHEVRLEPGGRIRAFFDGDPNSAGAQLDVDLEGRTALTARRPDLSVERYGIELRVLGDLLKDGGLTLTARSDPPDLTQEQILGQLGQTQLLESFGGSVSGNETERRIRDALAGYALPAVFGNFTDSLAKGLAFDFLTLEYNPYDLVTVSFAKRVGPGLSFIGRRQVGEPPPGFPSVFEWKLQYRPARRGVLGRFSLSFGADQDRPWKGALEYSLRF
ncbi:MAG: translocation/assembly module TamB domain-containing protein [Fimbriimonas sp.]